MKTRTATPENMAQIIELAEKHGLSIPKEGTITLPAPYTVVNSTGVRIDYKWQIQV